MFCQNCGSQISDQAKFCSKCGRSTQQIPSGSLSGWGNVDGWDRRSGVAPEVKKKKFPIYAVGAIGFLTVVILAVVLLLNPWSPVHLKIWTRSYEKPVENLVKGINKMDGHLILDAMFPDDLIERIEDETDYDEDELAEELEKGFEKSISKLFSGIYKESDLDLEDIDYEVSYRIDKATALKKSDLKDIEDEWDDADINIAIQNGKHLELTLKSKVDGGKISGEGSYEMEMNVIQIDEKWYIDITSLDM